MEIVDWIVQHVDQTYKQGNWAGKGVLPSIEGVTTEEAAWGSNPKQHAIGEIILHMAYWKDAVTERLSGRPWTYSEQMNWRPVPATAQGWEEAKAELAEAHERLVAALHSLRAERLFNAVSEPGNNDEGRTIDWAVGAAHHDMYHAAQVFVLRRAYKLQHS